MEEKAEMRRDQATESTNSNEKPLWLGSLARRGDTRTSGAGWADPETEDRPRWLGSFARRGDALRSQRGAGWSADDEATRSKWLGSLARRGREPSSESIPARAPSAVTPPSSGEPIPSARPEPEALSPERPSAHPRLSVIERPEPGGVEGPPNGPSDELAQKRAGDRVSGALGMPLRVA